MFLAKCSLKHFDSNSERREEGKGDREGGREEGNIFRVHLLTHSCLLPVASFLDLFSSLPCLSPLPTFFSLQVGSEA